MVGNKSTNDRHARFIKKEHTTPAQPIYHGGQGKTNFNNDISAHARGQVWKGGNEVVKPLSHTM